jgi:integrase
LSEARIKAGQVAHGRVEAAQMTRSDRDEIVAARKIVKDVPLLTALAEWLKCRDLAGDNAIAACKEYAARVGKVAKRVKVAEVVSEYVKTKRAAGNKTPDMHGSTFDRIKKDFGDIYLDAVSAKQIDAWLSQWENPVTRNTYRKRVIAVWRWAQGRKHLPHGVRTEAEMTEYAREAAPVIGIVSVSTWRGLLAHFHAKHVELLPALVLAGFCGLRRSEIHAQTWEDVSLERKNLRVSQGKRGTPGRRMVPLCDAAVAWLMLGNNRTGSICPSVMNRKGHLQPSLALDGIRRIAKEATNPDGTLRFPSVPENCFRHSYISHRVAATGDIPRVRLDAGNSPKEINRHYRELVSEDEGKAWFTIAPGATAEVIDLGKAAS